MLIVKSEFIIKQIYLNNVNIYVKYNKGKTYNIDIKTSYAIYKKI